MSPGNLYRYFPSKEALIAGIAERDRAEVAQEFASADLSHGFFAVLEGMAHHHFAERPDEQVLLCTEIMSESRRNPEIARISAAFDADVKEWLVDLLRAAAERGDIPGDLDFDGVVTMLMVIADGVWWRRALDPRFRRRSRAADLHGYHAPHAAQPAQVHGRDHGRRRPETEQDRADESKPHHRGRAGRRGRALDRVRALPAARDRARAAPPSVRRGRGQEAVPRRRRRDERACRTAASSCCPAAPRPTSKVTVTARTGGVLTELRVRRGARVKKGDVIAVLSDDAREAAGRAGGSAWSIQRQTELEAKRKLIANGTLPKLELVNLEAQLKAAEAALAVAEAERDRGVVRAPWSGIVHDVAVEVGHAAFSMLRPRDRDRSSRSIRCWRWSRCPSASSPASRSATRRRCGSSPARRASGKIRFVAKTASQTTRTYRVEVELPNPDGAIPDGITAEVAIPLAPVAATRVPRSALTFSSTGDSACARSDDGRHRRLRAASRWSRTSRPSCGSPAFPTARA